MRAFAVLVCLCSILLAPAEAATLRGDALWREDPHCAPGWEAVGTDDSTWQPVAFPWIHVLPPAWDVDPEARPFWGRSGERTSCVRRSFSLQRIPSAATARLWVDDDYELFVNGVAVGRSSDGEGRLPGESFVITPHLRAGANVIALRLIDVGGTRAALFSLEVPGEPEFAAPSLPIRPWWTALACVVLALAWLAGLRQVGKRLGRLGRYQPAQATAASALALACLIQVFLAGVVLYHGERDIPVLQWNTGAVACLVLLVSCLLLNSRRLRLVPTPPLRRAHEIVLLVLVLLVAIVMRVAWIDTIPVGFFQDEATNGNDARTIGAQPEWYLWSDSIGGRPTLFLYLLEATFRLWGASYVTLKVVPIVAGCATVLALYGLARIGFGARIALWAAFLLAVSRWHVHYSRIAWEAILLPLFAVAGLGLLLYGLSRRRGANIAIVAAGGVLAAGLYSYAAYRAVPAIVVVWLGWLWLSPRRQLVANRRYALIAAALVALAVSAPLLRFAWEKPDLYWERYDTVSLTAFMRYFGTPLPWFDQIGRSALSLHHLGDEIIRHNLPYAPHLDPITGILSLLGMALGAWRLRHPGVRLAWAWLLTYTALASLTIDGPHATRLLGLAPVVMLFAALALEQLRTAFWTWGSDASRRGVALLLAATLLAVNGHAYFVLEARHPTAADEFNVTGRSLCEMVRRIPGVEVYWSRDIAYWAAGQCLFLARDRHSLPRELELNDLLPGSTLFSGEQVRLAVIGPEMVRLHPEVLRPVGDELRLTVAPQPRAVHDPNGKLLYWVIEWRPGASP